MAELNKLTAVHQDREAGSDHEILAPEGSPPSPLVVLEQVRVVDAEGNLKVLYPSKTDLHSSLLAVLH